MKKNDGENEWGIPAGAQCCSNCRYRFIDNVITDEDLGELMCRRYPPKLVPASVEIPRIFREREYEEIWPSMAPDEWCGEFQAEKAAIKNEKEEEGKG